MLSKQVTIASATGLHARPASQFVQVAKGFSSDVRIANIDKGTAPVNAKSIMMILAAGLGPGTKVELTCDGADVEAAMAALLEIKDGSELLFSE